MSRHCDRSRCQRPVARYIVQHHRVGALAQQLVAAVLHAILGFGCEAHDELLRADGGAHLRENVLRRRKFQL